MSARLWFGKEVTMSEAKQLTERLIEVWNKHDKNAYVAFTADDGKVKGVGGFSGTGKAGAEQFFAMWNDSFPDNRVTARRIVSEGDVAILEGTFTGTHTGPLQAPSGPIPATGKRVSQEFVNALTYSGGKVKDSQVIFDQMELLSQLGLVPSPAAASTR
jgi:steroid delta-isomerase-like uncharacterized protein